MLPCCRQVIPGQPVCHARQRQPVEWEMTRLQGRSSATTVGVACTGGGEVEEGSVLRAGSGGVPQLAL